MTNPIDECAFCGKPYTDHILARALGAPVPRMPCAGLKSGFQPRRPEPEPPQNDRPDPRQVERALAEHPDDTLAREVRALREELAVCDAAAKDLMIRALKQHPDLVALVHAARDIGPSGCTADAFVALIEALTAFEHVP